MTRRVRSCWLRWWSGRWDHCASMTRRIGTDLVRTLEVYLDHGGSLRQAAATLMVHPNTVEYRLQRMSDLSGWGPA